MLSRSAENSIPFYCGIIKCMYLPYYIVHSSADVYTLFFDSSNSSFLTGP
jgi:hypothetical protein